MSALHIVLHAPTAGAFARALSNAANITKTEPDAVLELVVNGQGARAAVESANESAAKILRYCVR
jgi:intracellular sulfur oxidation DsrE/DsrF family protein